MAREASKQKPLTARRPQGSTVLVMGFQCQHPPPVLQPIVTTEITLPISTKWGNRLFPANAPRHPLECQPFRNMLGRTTPEKKHTCTANSASGKKLQM